MYGYEEISLQINAVLQHAHTLSAGASEGPTEAACRSLPQLQTITSIFYSFANNSQQLHLIDERGFPSVLITQPFDDLLNLVFKTLNPFHIL
jgi:hypothetical protein